MKHAITQLQNALNVVEINEPINRANGNIEQADLESACADSYRKAIGVLENCVDSGEPFGVYDHFNEVLYRGEDMLNEVKMAVIGGNAITALYVKQPQSEAIKDVLKKVADMCEAEYAIYDGIACAEAIRNLIEKE